MRHLALSICVLILIATPLLYSQARTKKSGSGLVDAPQKVRTLENPFRGNESARAAGKKLFERHCAECHGQSAEGGAEAPPLRAASEAATPGMLQWFIKNGNLRAGMPSWSRLPDQQLWQLVTYLQALSN